MAEHLGEQTLPADKVELAQYYQRGMSREFAGDLRQDTFAVEAAALLKAGTSLDELPEAMQAAVAARHSAFVDAYIAGEHRDVDEAAVLATLAEFVTASEDPAAEARETEYRLTAELESRIFDLE